MVDGEDAVGVDLSIFVVVVILLCFVSFFS